MIPPQLQAKEGHYLLFLNQRPANKAMMRQVQSMTFPYCNRPAGFLDVSGAASRTVSEAGQRKAAQALGFLVTVTPKLGLNSFAVAGRVKQWMIPKYVRLSSDIDDSMRTELLLLR